MIDFIAFLLLALYNIGDMVHSARGKWGIKANCPCASRHTKPLVRPSAPNGISQVLLCHIIFLSSTFWKVFNLVIQSYLERGSNAWLCLSQQSATSSGGVLAAAASGIGTTSKSEGETSAIKTEATQTAAPSDSGGGETVGSTSNSTSGTSSPCNLIQSSAKESRSSGEGNSSALHWLADLATQKAKDDTKGKSERRNAESVQSECIKKSQNQY